MPRYFKYFRYVGFSVPSKLCIRSRDTPSCLPRICHDFSGACIHKVHENKLLFGISIPLSKKVMYTANLIFWYTWSTTKGGFLQPRS